MILTLEERRGALESIMDPVAGVLLKCDINLSKRNALIWCSGARDSQIGIRIIGYY